MIDLDAMLTADEAAAWMQISKRELLSKCQGRRAPIPAFRSSAKMVRFHPRTIISKLANDAGVKFEVIAASFGEKTI